MTKFDEYDQLMIRACKSKNHNDIIRRLRKIWAMRCYIPSHSKLPIPLYPIISHLYHIIQNRKGGFDKLAFLSLLDKLMPILPILDEKLTTDEQVTSVLVNIIRHTRTEDWLDPIIPPMIFRNKVITQ